MSGFSSAEMAEAARRLTAAGCVAPWDEAEELAAAALGDAADLAGFLERRIAGEPLAWITGTCVFCGCPVDVRRGVYVPRWQSEPMAERAAELLPPGGRAIDLGTGSGAIARVLLDRRPDASVLGTECDPIAARCARGNGVAVAEGDLFDGVPASWRRTVDVIVAVLPYVPTAALVFLPRDVRDFEPSGALDGGGDGLDVIRRALGKAPQWLRPGGHVLFEIGGDQPEALALILQNGRFGDVNVMTDEDGDPRALVARHGGGGARL